MSFMLTTEQVVARAKTQTRRLGWKHLKVDDLVRAVEKAMGLPKGGHVRTLAILHITEVRREALNQITKEEVAREGYPHMTPERFVAKFCAAMKCTPETIVTVIDFCYLD